MASVCQYSIVKLWCQIHNSNSICFLEVFFLLISVVSSSAAKVLTKLHQVRLFSEMAISQVGAYILSCSCMENYRIILKIKSRETDGEPDWEPEFRK